MRKFEFSLTLAYFSAGFCILWPELALSIDLSRFYGHRDVKRAGELCPSGLLYMHQSTKSIVTVFAQ
jgi:hypothetical protein